LSEMLAKLEGKSPEEEEFKIETEWFNKYYYEV
jgi:hypothetical protein